MSKFDLPRATRDFPPGETAARNLVRAAFIQSAEVYGFQEIQTPVFEHVELFLARSGPEIKGSMLTFHCDHEEFALRPEMTAPVCRLMSSDLLVSDYLPHKFSYFGPCFRYTRPDSGRYREFLQAGMECLGASGPEVDAEVIAASARTLNSLGIEDFTLRIGNMGIFRDLMPDDFAIEEWATVIGHLDRLNSIHEKCRLLANGLDESILGDLRIDRMELAALQEQTGYTGPHAIANKSHLDPTEYAKEMGPEAETTFRRLWEVEETVPMETAELLIQISRLRGPIQTVREEAFSLLRGSNSTTALAELFAVCEAVEMYGIHNFNVALGIARGFTFYTSTVFEITSGLADGDRLYCGGGRYDRLVELFGGPATPSMGCAFRFDTLVEAFRNANAWKQPRPYQIFLLSETNAELHSTIQFSEELRKRGLRVGVGLGKPTSDRASDLAKHKTDALAYIYATDSIRLLYAGTEEELPLDATKVSACVKSFNDESS